VTIDPTFSADSAGPLASSRKKSFRIPVANNLKPVLGAALFLIVMMIAFTVAEPDVFLDFGIYTAVFLSLPLFIILGLGLVFVTVSGESDLSFPSTVALSGLTYTVVYEHFRSPTGFALGLLAALGVGASCGLINGILVTRFGLSSLITTLGMNFALIGLTQILNQGRVRLLGEFDTSQIRSVIVGSWGPIPAQMFWALGLAVVLGLIFHRHKFGIHTHIVGDNPDAGRAMGVNVERTKTIAFIIVGVCAALTSVMAILLNSTYFSTMGDGYLLPVLAAVFVGGTPVGGGRGTIGGLAVGAATVVFIQTGVVAIGLDGYWTSLGFGVVIVLSLIGHRWSSSR
jgi:ribose/xylose/arabinose/galactoside ABC-type transport system permease subunit